ELVSRNLGMMLRRGIDLVPKVEDRPLPRDLVGLRSTTPRQRLLQALEHPPPRRPGRVESPALDQRLDRPLVRRLRSDPPRQVPERLERSPLLARPDDRPRGPVP